MNAHQRYLQSCVCSLLVTVVLGLPIRAAESAAIPAKIVVNVGKPGVTVSPLLYGIFFEEINHAGDGGIYAEMVQNCSFEEPAKAKDPFPAWELRTDKGGEATMKLENAKPMSALNPHYLVLNIAKPGGRVGIVNDGFRGLRDNSKGMYVREGAEYRLSFAARAANGFTGSLIATLETPEGKILASSEAFTPGRDWTKLTGRFVANATSTTARLVVAARGTGAVDLDMISLFPKDTWKGRENGWRPDLIQKLVDMKPAFVRFPGGCWVEGSKLADAYRWKKTIGDVSERWTQPNLWHYQSCNGLGFHEYLLLCEDLNAEPLFCLNCGMSHTEMRTQPKNLDGVQEYIQDALDAIEYANGPVDSHWGALRAKAGHPAPFNLKYLEIGNENSGPAYKLRYAAFREAIKAKYPEMHLVCNTYEPDPSTVEISDEHYYPSPEFFLRNADKYDKYERSRPKVFVGEYAVTNGSGAGNLIAAVSEAAFMTGMERNSDHVVMASYAPLFADVHYKGWNPDAICFDNSRVFGTPSYHVQKLFAANRGDIVLPLTIEQPAVSRIHSGAIGVGTWNTAAEFKDIVVTRGDQVLGRSDFSSNGTVGWKFEHGNWSVEDAALRQTEMQRDRQAKFGDSSWSNYTLRLKARKLEGAEGFLITFLSQPGGGRIWWNLGGWGNSAHGIEGAGDVPKVAGKIESGHWYDIRIELDHDHAQCFLDDKKIHDFTLSSPAAVYAVAGRVKATNEVVLKLVNACGTEVGADIDLQGAANVAKTAAASVVTGGNTLVENTLEEPERVAIKTSQVAIAGPAFKQTLPPWSVTVLRVKAE